MFLAGIPAGLFVGRKEYDRRMAEFMKEVKGSRKAAGTERILFPGELESEKRSRQQADGIVIEDRLLETIQNSSAC